MEPSEKSELKPSSGKRGYRTVARLIVFFFMLTLITVTLFGVALAACGKR